jgi:hypothetical protein
MKKGMIYKVRFPYQAKSRLFKVLEHSMRRRDGAMYPYYRCVEFIFDKDGDGFWPTNLTVVEDSTHLGSEGFFDDRRRK